MNLSKWAEAEGGGELVRGCPLKETMVTRGAGPTGLRLLLQRPSVGTLVWVVAGPAGSE